jgi:hypothetical protein
LLENLSEEVRQCYVHAEECTGLARDTQDEKLRADYLRLAQTWLKLAASYEFWVRLKLFTNEAARRKNDWQPISIAPFNRNLELAVRDGGDLHVLDFPCCRILSGWIKAATMERICVNPTHWRHWSDAGARRYS